MLIHNAKNLAMYLRNIRKKQKLSQAAAGDLVGIKQATISAFENKPDHVQLDTLFRLLSALNLEMEINPKGEALKPSKDSWDEEW